MWEYLGRDWGSTNHYWTNAGGGGSDIARYSNGYALTDTSEFSNMPPADAEIIYGALGDYGNDIVALCNDWGIYRESL